MQELGLDLDTLDTMDFSSLDCDLEVKTEMSQELMEIGDVPMDMDPDWLDSWIPQSPPGSSTSNHHHHHHHYHHNNNNQQHSPQSVQSTVTDIHDPMLANSQDPFELFSMEDTDFKMSSEIPLSWDKCDFAT